MNEKTIRLLKAQNIAKTPYLVSYVSEGVLLRVGIDVTAEASEILLQSGSAELVNEKETTAMSNDGKVKAAVKGTKKA